MLQTLSPTGLTEANDRYSAEALKRFAFELLKKAGMNAAPAEATGFSCNKD